MTIIDKHNLGWAEYVNKLEQQNAEMLEALKEILAMREQAEVVGDIEPIFDKAQQAIAKAEGKE